MERQDDSLIEELTAKFECPKKFKCYTSGFTELCKAKYVNSGKHLQCIDKDVSNCMFSSLQGNLYICECPVRIYLAKELNR